MSLDDRYWMRLAIKQAEQCPVSDTAFSVGAVIVDEQGLEVARGFSRETDPKVHAEESALEKLDLPDDTLRRRLATSTIYSTLEPCSQRASRPKPCARLILETGIQRVVTAWREPSLFVADAQGVEQLEDSGVQVIELPEFAEAAKAPNSHLNLS